MKKGIQQAAVYMGVILFTVLLIFILFKWNTIQKTLGTILEIMTPIIFGFVIAYVLLPVVGVIQRGLQNTAFARKYCQDKKGERWIRGISVCCALLLSVSVFGVLAYLVIPQLVLSITQIISRFPGYTRQVSEWFDQIQMTGSITSEIEMLINQGMDFFQKWMQNDFLPKISQGINVFTLGIMNVFGFFYNMIIGIIISVYILMSVNVFTGQSKKLTYALFKPDTANSIIDVVRHSHQIFSGFIIGKLIDSAIIGGICFVILYFIQMPYAMLVSVIVGVTNIIPFFGPYIGAVPCTLLIGLTDFKQGVIFLIFIIVLQQVDGNIIGPRILGNSTGLSPFWVIFSILVGGGLFGFPGMLLGVPVFAVFYYLVKTFVEYVLYKKEMPLETETYVEAEGYDLQTKRFIYISTEEETFKERKERYGSYKNVRIEQDLKRQKDSKKEK